jgi:hypothetical protein
MYFLATNKLLRVLFFNISYEMFLLGISEVLLEYNFYENTISPQ